MKVEGGGGGGKLFSTSIYGLLLLLQLAARLAWITIFVYGRTAAVAAADAVSAGYKNECAHVA